jgi:predicted nucleotidyltransferase
MGTQPTHIRIPEGSRLFIFGSVLTSSSPNDLDVLVVYDPVTCPSHRAYAIHRDLVSDLEDLYALPVHLTLLTPSEELGTAFIARTKAVAFDPVSTALREGGSSKHG